MFALAALMLAATAVPAAPAYEPSFDPSRLKQTVAGEAGQALVLGSPHLSGFPKDFDAKALDPLLARLDRAGDAWFDDAVLSPSLGDLDADDVTSFVAGLGLLLGWRATMHADSGPAGLQEFRITEARRLLAGARRRLS